MRFKDALSTRHLNADLKGRSVRGGVWTAGSQGANFLIQSLSTVILARLLTPAAFADLRRSEATIQREDINDRQVSAFFWDQCGDRAGAHANYGRLGSGSGLKQAFRNMFAFLERS